MNFTDKELRIILQSLYRLRSDVSGASQVERNRFENVESIVNKIEEAVGSLTPEDTPFDREMGAALAKGINVGVAKTAKPVPAKARKVLAKPASPNAKVAAKPKTAIKQKTVAAVQPKTNAGAKAKPAAKAKAIAKPSPAAKKSIPVKKTTKKTDNGSANGKK